jgi:hypothetical protein
VPTYSLTLTLLLLFGAPEGTPTATEDLTAKIAAVLETPEAAMIGELEYVIRELEARPQDVIADKALADELLRARVVLAWAQQDPERAAAAMDEAIRSAAGRELPLKGLGTELKTLAKQRAAALEGMGTATIELHCSVPCQVIVNERRSVNPTDPLPLGTYRVWVIANEGNVEPVRADVVLDAAGETERIEFGRVEEVPPPAVIEPPMEERRKRSAPRAPAEQEANVAGRKPLMPLWVEIVGVVAGAGLAATGAGLLAIDGRCKGGGDPATCPTLIETTAQGVALVALGAGAMVSFGAVLGVDQVRAGRAMGAGAMVSWTFRF